MMSVNLSNKGKTIEVEDTANISREDFQGTAQRLICIKLPAEGPSKSMAKDKVGRLVKEHVCNPRRFPTSGNLIM